jgi:hypothetical protein
MTKTVVCDSLPRAAFFIASGIEPIGSEPLAEGRRAWIFEASERLDALSSEYYRQAGGAGLILRFMRARGRLLEEARKR